MTELAGGRDDFAASTSDHRRGGGGRSVTGEIEKSFDLDWFRVNLDGGTTYRIDLEPTPTGSGPE